MATQRFGGGALRCSSAADPRWLLSVLCSIQTVPYFTTWKPACTALHHHQPQSCVRPWGGSPLHGQRARIPVTVFTLPSILSVSVWPSGGSTAEASEPICYVQTLSPLFLQFLIFCKRLRAMACAPEDCVTRWTQNGARHVTICVGT